MSNQAAAENLPMPQAHVTENDNGESTFLTEAVHKAFERAMKRNGKVIEAILHMPGMSGQKYRYFINNLIESLPDARYLEVGSWAGSTMCSAIYANKVRAFAIDNWSEFGGPSGHFLKHVGACMTPHVQFNMLCEDFRKVDYNTLGKFNVYLFDGPHEEKDQYDGVVAGLPAVDDEYVFIVDDWNWDRVRDGTLNAIKDQNLEILYSIEVRTTLNNSHPDVAMEKSEWHNGYFISVLRKPKK